MLISGFNRLVLTDAHAHNVFYYYDPISKDFYVKLIDINFEAIGPHELHDWYHRKTTQFNPVLIHDERYASANDLLYVLVLCSQKSRLTVKSEIERDGEPYLLDANSLYINMDLLNYMRETHDFSPLEYHKVIIYLVMIGVLINLSKSSPGHNFTSTGLYYHHDIQVFSYLTEELINQLIERLFETSDTYTSTFNDSSGITIYDSDGNQVEIQRFVLNILRSCQPLIDEHFNTTLQSIETSRITTLTSLLSDPSIANLRFNYNELDRMFNLTQLREYGGRYSLYRASTSSELCTGLSCLSANKKYIGKKFQK